MGNAPPNSTPNATLKQNVSTPGTTRGVDGSGTSHNNSYIGVNNSVSSLASIVTTPVASNRQNIISNNNVSTTPQNQTPPRGKLTNPLLSLLESKTTPTTPTNPNPSTTQSSLENPKSPPLTPKFEDDSTPTVPSPLLPRSNIIVTIEPPNLSSPSFELDTFLLFGSHLSLDLLSKIFYFLRFEDFQSSSLVSRNWFLFIHTNEKIWKSLCDTTFSSNPYLYNKLQFENIQLSKKSVPNSQKLIRIKKWRDLFLSYYHQQRMTLRREKVVALYSYIKKRDDEINLTKDEVLYVLERQERGNEGDWVLLEKAPVIKAAEERRPVCSLGSGCESQEPSHWIKYKHYHPGEKAAEEQKLALEALATKIMGWAPTGYVETIREPSPGPKPPLPHAVDRSSKEEASNNNTGVYSRDLVMGLYDYKTMTGPELSFKKHDLMMVEKKEVREGFEWYVVSLTRSVGKGKTEKQRGYVPVNMVESNVRYAVGMFDYEAMRAGELSMKKGSRVVVLKMNGETGMWYVQGFGQRGWVPDNLLTPVGFW
eukprot:TRINITY_DN26464_c0_g1_i1.p1 TRINITY_DN26464_c0_g1~~TRINITY_DN26464_c0_g1_i1.p1  ORF type:complete len:537 (+),score=160.17 TRINITY_DN26464_c0_g1_i1:152-1762(+)